MRLHAVEVMPDHVHLFVGSEPTLCVAEIVNRFKGRTSRVLRQEFPSLRYDCQHFGAAATWRPRLAPSRRTRSEAISKRRRAVECCGPISTASILPDRRP